MTSRAFAFPRREVVCNVSGDWPELGPEKIVIEETAVLYIQDLKRLVYAGPRTRPLFSPFLPK